VAENEGGVPVTKKPRGHCWNCDKRTTRVESRVKQGSETVVTFECLECSYDLGY